MLSHHLPRAKQLLKAEQQGNPQNLVPYYLFQYRDFLRLYIHGNTKLYDSLDNVVDERLSQLEAGPSSSPYHTFSQAEVYLFWALLELRQWDYLSAGVDFYRAYKHYQSAQEQFPDFLPAQRVLKAIQGVVGTLPDTYQWIVERFGIKGRLPEAVESYPELMRGLQAKPEWRHYHRESAFVFSYMQLHLMDQPDKAWQTMKAGTRNHRDNPISCLLRANMALNLKKGRKALELLERYQHQPAPIPYLNYLTGSAMLYALQPDSRQYLQRYIRDFKGGTYIKDTYLKKGWAALLEGNIAAYRKNQQKVREAGSTVRAVDQQALKEADRYNKDNRYMLKARLRYDGGYFKQAQAILSAAEPPPLSAKSGLNAIEYYYRKGKVAKARNNPEKALAAFDQLRQLDRSQQQHYYLPAAHLQAGLVYEAQKKPEPARQAFQAVLAFNGYPYERALSQKAKAGLKRSAHDN